jgi:hypothetical protein
MLWGTENKFEIRVSVQGLCKSWGRQRHDNKRPAIPGLLPITKLVIGQIQGDGIRGCLEARQDAQSRGLTRQRVYNTVYGDFESLGQGWLVRCGDVHKG